VPPSLFFLFFSLSLPTFFASPSFVLNIAGLQRRNCMPSLIVLLSPATAAVSTEMALQRNE
jgi:hypothetical protein